MVKTGPNKNQKQPQTKRKIAVITEKESDIIKLLDTHNIITSKGIDFARNAARIIESNARYSNNQSYYKNLADEAIKESQKKEILSESNKRYGLVFALAIDARPKSVIPIMILLHLLPTSIYWQA
jgi:hypothetical protein